MNRSGSAANRSAALRAAPAAPLRAFFALWPDPAVREALVALGRDVAARLHGRASAAGNVHLTLAFLGDVDASRVGALRAIGAAMAAAAHPFSLALDRVGTFRGAGIAWAGASAEPHELARLAAALRDALAADGYTVDARPFHPHLTLARRCRKRAEFPLAAPIAWTVAQLTLNASELSAEGPRYREIDQWALGARADAI